jgi:dinuclear metal center YbgI/SA1388 family protein
MPLLKDIVSYTDRYLRIREVGDWDNALNGLQIENSGRVTRIGAAVDISTRVLKSAAKQKLDLLVVHHGLFWPGLQPIRGALGRQLRLAFENDIALYSAHLPLDVHPKLGNNAQLLAALGLKSAQQNCRASVSDASPTARRFTERSGGDASDTDRKPEGRASRKRASQTPYKSKSPQPFLEEKGQLVGLKLHASLTRSELIRKLQQALNGRVKAFAFGPTQTRTIGIVTGAAGSEIYRVGEENIDTFITGEAPHWAAVAAEELGMNLLLGGHYATEVFGVKALAAHLSQRFRVAWEFIDCPTGL